MRKSILLSISVLLSLGLAGAASAESINWEGTSVLLLGDFEATDIPGGGVATVNGTGGLGHLDTLRIAASRGNVGTEFTLIVTDPTSDIKLIQFIGVEGGTGTFAPVSGAVGSTPLTKNQLPLAGIVRLCIFDQTCNNAFELILSTPTTVNGIPQGGVNAVGVGGTIGGGDGLFLGVSVEGAPWTVKQVTVVDQITTLNGNQTFIDVTFKGFVHGPASGSGGSSTANIGGVLQLVTPSQVVTTIPTGSNEKVSSGVIFLIRFIPEPGLLLLLGSGVVGLAVLGRKRMQK